ncbi:hypothetical protein TcasGA2_TC031109 [Tribolium castaneum]|uniref:Uncharacterized protein n=1 Tax=Tribolium castaneum TaxID=7070 RepID=A0A139WJQ2_TRICA|nr:hypothetical protein TcasGA2_TC031109 [Tribolium castaneum]
MLLWYSSFFKHVTSWCYGTAIVQFVVFLFIFLGVSYLSTLLDIDYSVDQTREIISKYEKYIVLASSLYMIVPFTFSTVFLFGLFNKNPVILKIFIIESLINCFVILIVVIASGIFLAVKGTQYIAYSLIVLGIVLEIFLAHGILLAYGARDVFLQNCDNRSSVNSGSNQEDPYVLAGIQFVFFLLVMLVPSYSSLFLQIEQDVDESIILASKLEKYGLMASSLFMVFPLTFSLIFFVGLLHKNRTILLVYMFECFVTYFAAIIICALGICLIVFKASIAIAFYLIIFGIVVQFILTHGLIMTEAKTLLSKSKIVFCQITMLLFKHTTENCCKFAAFQFVTFLIVFLVPSYLSLFIEKKKISEDMKFSSHHPQFEKYAVMALSLYMIIPLTFSIVFFIGVLHKNGFYILIYILESCFTTIITFVLVVLGLYEFSTKGTCIIGYSMFAVGVFLSLLVIHGIVVAFREREKLRKIRDNHIN